MAPHLNTAVLSLLTAKPTLIVIVSLTALVAVLWGVQRYHRAKIDGLETRLEQRTQERDEERALREHQEQRAEQIAGATILYQREVVRHAEERSRDAETMIALPSDNAIAAQSRANSMNDLFDELEAIR